jgi:uncharacterized protein YdhG (YjbR/CyaY superfamily)
MTTIDEYIAGFPADVQQILQRIRATIRKAAPEAEEVISYRMPAFKQGGILVYIGAFKSHIGLYPPVSDPELQRESARYAGEKGNLRFPYAEPMPYDLIRRIVLQRVGAQRAKAATKRPRKTPNAIT